VFIPSNPALVRLNWRRYCNKDRKFAEELDKRIRADAGLDTWFFSEGIRAGDQWKKEIDRAIEECHAMVVVMTPDAMKSMYVTYEWAYAMGLRKPVVPILLKESELHPKLDDIQHRDFTTDPYPWDRFIEDLKVVVESQAERDWTIMVPRDAPRAVRRAVDELDSPDPEIRKRAVDSLAGIPHPAAYEVLIKALRHLHYDVADYAARCLKELSSREREGSVLEEVFRTGNIGTSYLNELLSARERCVRAVAAKLLGRFGDATDAPGLSEALRDGNPDVRVAVAEALGEIGDPAAVEGLVETLGDAKVRGAARQALVKIGEPAVLMLVAALSDEDNVRGVATRALVEIGEPAVPGLVEALGDDDSRVREAAALALEKIGSPEALEAVARWRESGEGGGAE
jgi:HEAT repeat protein